jgi:hypothetical protein
MIPSVEQRGDSANMPRAKHAREMKNKSIECKSRMIPFG